MATDDAKLVGKWKNGDMFAFKELHRRHDNKVFEAVRRLLRRHSRESHHIAEELCQETWITAKESLHKFQEQPFYPWLYTIALNLTRNWLRIKDNQQEPMSPDQIENRTNSLTTGAGAILENLIKEEQNRIVRETIESMKEQYRTVLTLNLEGWNSTEIAKKLERNSSTVRGQLHKGVKILIEKLLKHHPYLFDE